MFDVPMSVKLASSFTLIVTASNRNLRCRTAVCVITLPTLPYLTLRYRVIKGPRAWKSRSSRARKVPTASIRDWYKVPERSPMGIKPALEDVHSW